MSRAVSALLLSSGLVSIIGIAQYFYPGILANYEVMILRVFSTTGNALSLSIFLAMVIPFTIAFILSLWNKRKEGRRYKVLILVLAVLLALQFSCLYLSQYSVLLLLYIIGLIVFFLLLGIVRRIKALLISCAASLVFIAAVAGLIIVPILLVEFDVNSYQTKEGVPIINAEDLSLSTLELRAQYWHSAVEIVIDSPEIPFSDDRLHGLRKFIGYGPETFTITFQRAFPEVLKDQSLLVYPLSRPHNHYLYLATTMGLLGLASFLSILIIFFYVSFKYLRRATIDIDRFILISLVAGMVGFVADSIFNPSTLSAELVVWLNLSLVIVIGRLITNDRVAEGVLQGQSGNSDIVVSQRHIVRSLTSLGCLMLLIILGITITIKPFLADMKLQKGINSYYAQNEQPLLAFLKATELNPGEAVYWHYLGEYSFFKARATNDEVAKERFLLLSASAYRKALCLEPYMAYRYHSLASVYGYWAVGGNTDKWTSAFSLYDQASQLAPRDTFLLDKWSLALIANGNLDEARLKLSYAKDITPQWIGNNLVYGLLLIHEGKPHDAVYEIAGTLQDSPENIRYFIHMYFDLAVYDMVYPLEIAFEDYTQTVSNDWSSYTVLGITNMFLGDPDKSFTQFFNALILAPEENRKVVLSAISELARINPGFRSQIPFAASAWKAELIRNGRYDELQQTFNNLIERYSSD